MCKKLSYILLLSIFVFGHFSLKGQEKMSEDWAFKLAPYLWTVQIDAENTVGIATVPIDVKFSDIWDNLRFAGSLHYEMSKQEWSIIADFAYIDIYRENINIETPGPGTPIGNLDFTIWQGELLGAYRFGNPNATSYPEGLFGLRYTRQKLNLLVETTVEELPNPENGFDENWVDPIIGGRYTASFTPEFYGVFRADIGGFGIGAKFTWNIAGELGYKFSDLFGLVLGYRYLDVNYESGTKGTADYFAFVGNQHGIVLGALFTW